MPITSFFSLFLLYLFVFTIYLAFIFHFFYLLFDFFSVKTIYNFYTLCFFLLFQLFLLTSYYFFIIVVAFSSFFIYFYGIFMYPLRTIRVYELGLLLLLYFALKCFFFSVNMVAVNIISVYTRIRPFSHFFLFTFLALLICCFNVLTFLFVVF